MKINLGCGDDYREGYINVDFSSIRSDGKPIKVDLECNILKGLPFEDNEVEEVVFRETLEHLNRHNGLRVLKDIYRILKPKGLLDLTVPPAERQLKMLLTKMRGEVSFDDFERAHEKWSYWKFHDDLAGGTQESDGLDGDSHKTFYTKSALKSILTHVGFKIISIDDNIFVKAKK